MGIGDRAVAVALGEAVDVDDLGPEARLEAPPQPLVEIRGGRDDEPEVLACEAVVVVGTEIADQGEHRRHRDQVGDPVGTDALDQLGQAIDPKAQPAVEGRGRAQRGYSDAPCALGIAVKGLLRERRGRG